MPTTSRKLPIAFTKVAKLVRIAWCGRTILTVKADRFAVDPTALSGLIAAFGVMETRIGDTSTPKTNETKCNFKPYIDGALPMAPHARSDLHHFGERWPSDSYLR